MAKVASLNVSLDLSSARFKKGLDQARARSKKFAKGSSKDFKSIGKSIKNVVGLFSGFLALSYIKKTTGDIDALAKSARAVGVEFERFQRITFGLGQLGVDGTQVAKAFVRISQAMVQVRDGGVTASRIFNDLGLSYKKLDALTPADRFKRIVDAISSVRSSHIRLNASSLLLGKGFVKLTGGYKDIIEQAKGLQVISVENASSIEDFNDKLALFNANLQTAGTKTLPYFTKALAFFAGNSLKVNASLILLTAGILKFGVLGKLLTLLISPLVRVGSLLTSMGLGTEGLSVVLTRLTPIIIRFSGVVGALVFVLYQFAKNWEAVKVGLLAVAFLLRDHVAPLFKKFSTVVAGVGKTFAVFIVQSVAMRQTLIDLANPITFVVKQFSKLNNILTPTINKVYEFFGKSKVGTAISDAAAKAEESLRKPAKTVTQTNQKIVANTLAMQAELTHITAQGLLDRYELEGGLEGKGAFDVSKYQSQTSAQVTFIKNTVELFRRGEKTKLQLGVKAGAETLALVSKTNKTAFNLNKRYQQAQATMDTYRGVTKVLAEFPPPLSFIMAGAVLTFGLAQIGKIESQQFQGLATGGRVTSGGNFVVGERGAEIVNLPRGSAVTSNADVGRSLDNTQDTYNITVNVSGDNDNIGDAVEKGILEAIDQGRLDSVHSLQQRTA